MRRLHKATFDCEVLTPMFLGGADPNHPELRVASIRGAMRYWLRAILGGRYGADLKKVYQEEEKVFGSSEKGGAVSLRIVNEEPIETGMGGSVKGKQESGTAYLWYAVDMGVGNNKRFIRPGTRFRVIMSSKEEESLLLAIEAFYVLSKLGGLGTRSRRMAGSFHADLIEQNVPTLKIDFSDSLKENLEKLTKTMMESLPSTPSFSVLHRESTEVWCSFGYRDDWQQITDRVGSALKQFRKDMVKSNGDLRRIKAFASDPNNEVPEKINNASFGLPLSYRLKEGRGRTDVGINLEGSLHEDPNISTDRRASPLFLTVAREEDKLVPVLTFMKSLFVPSEAKITIKLKNVHSKAIPKRPDMGVIEQFIEDEIIQPKKIFGD